MKNKYVSLAPVGRDRCHVTCVFYFILFHKTVHRLHNFKHNRNPLIQTWLDSTTSGQKLQRVHLICCYKQSPLSWEHLLEECETCCKDLLPLSHKNITEFKHWCCVIRCHSWGSRSQRWRMSLVSGFCAGLSSCTIPIWKKHSFMDPAWCTAALSCWNRKEPSTNCWKQFFF